MLEKYDDRILVHACLTEGHSNDVTCINSLSSLPQPYKISHIILIPIFGVIKIKLSL